MRRTVFFLFILCLALVSSGRGQTAISNNDSIGSQTSESAPILRPVNTVKFDQSALKGYREDPDYAYSLPPEQRIGLLQLILLKIEEWLYQLFGNRGVANFFLWFLIVVVTVGLGWVLVVVFGGSTSKIFFNPERSKLAYSVEEEDLDKIDFAMQIDEALRGQSYRKVIRLTYLYAIKLLTNKALIDWKPWKTNHDYMYELKSPAIRDDFSELSYYFDYVWYGDFTADRSLCDEAVNVIKHLKQNLSEV